MKTPVVPSDLLKLNFLSVPSLSPDGETAAYRVSRACVESDSYIADIWLCRIDTGESRKLTSSGREGCFCWSLDGESIVFASKRGEKRDGAHTSFYRIPVCGGEAEPLFEIPHDASQIWDIGGGRWLVKAVFVPEYDNPENADYMVFDQIPFLTNGSGCTGQRRTGLGIFDVKTGEFKRLLSPNADVARVTVSGGKALAVACEFTDIKPMTNHVFMIDLETGGHELLTKGLEYSFKCARLDGNLVVVTAADMKEWGVTENPKLWLLSAGDDGAPKMMGLAPELDVSLGHPVGGDTSWGCRDNDGDFRIFGGEIVCSASCGFKTRINAVTGEGRLSVLTPSVSSVTDYDVGEKRIIYTAYEGLYPAELYVYEDGRERRLTSFNRDFADERALSVPIHVTFENDGVTFDGWYMRPTGAGEGQRCPTIFNIHGGPRGTFGDIYFHEMQCWASRGYAVIYCNPRGSDGRGNKFADIRGRYGEDDYGDLMAFADWCVEHLDFIDKDDICVTGGSYGGYMTNWIITHTDRFVSAVSQRGIANWISKFGETDNSYYYVPDQHLGMPWKDPEMPWRDSPVAYASNAKTPTLFLHSTDDFRCNVGQGMQMFTALKMNGVRTRLCVFKGENHELSRSGKPRNRLARMRMILDWFDSRKNK